MKIKLLIATADEVYAKLLSDNISEHHSDTLDVSVCCTLERLNETEATKNYEVALLDTKFSEHINTDRIHLPILLWSENETSTEQSGTFEKINKYQRISSVVATILERYAKISAVKSNTELRQANISAVWSPAGGVGKTSVAIAYALSYSSKDSISKEKEVFYLNLENFSSIPGYFTENGRSISSVFEMLESTEGNIEMFIQGISSHDKNITFLSSPDNYDDMCILSNENVKELVSSCAKLADELIIDLSCACDIRVKEIFEMANKIFIVTDKTSTAGIKLTQFMTQNNVFELIKDKVTIVANKDAVIDEPKCGSVISLPYLQAVDTCALCTSLSEYFSKELDLV